MIATWAESRQTATQFMISPAKHIRTGRLSFYSYLNEK